MMHSIPKAIRDSIKYSITLLLLVTCMAGLSLHPNGLAAQDATPTSTSAPASDPGPQFVIHPANANDGDYFTLEAEAGTTNELAVILGNADDEVLSLSTYVATAIPSTNGGFLLAQQDEPLTGAATWIDYETETYDLQPGKGIERSFFITIPDDTAPGQYIAGLVLQTAEPLPVAGSTQYTQIIRKPIAVLIVVPGDEAPTFALGDPEVLAGAAVDSIVIPVVNSGNVLVKPVGELSLYDATGKTVFQAPIEMRSVYAGFTVPLQVQLSSSVPDGEYTMSLTLSDKATGATTSVEGERILISNEVQAPVQFAIVADVVAEPDVNDPVFLNVSATVTNNGEAVNSSEIVLEVMKDGELQESFALASSLSLKPGETEVSQRYIPPTGFDSGEWTFVIRLNMVDPSSGAATTVVTLEDIPVIVVP